MSMDGKHKFLLSLQLTAEFSRRHPQATPDTLKRVHHLFSVLVALEAVEEYERVLSERGVA
jgi:hypothetical protein